MSIFNILKPRPKTIAQLLGIKLKTLPNQDFDLIKEDVNKDKIKSYLNNNHNVYGLFESIEVKVLENSKNIIFRAPQIKNYKKLKKLVNGLYKLYGKDDLENTKFTPSDLRMIQRGTWTGRLYGLKNAKESTNSIWISYNKSSGLEMTIVNA